jgi:hypothetical protein
MLADRRCGISDRPQSDVKTLRADSTVTVKREKAV